MSRNFDGLDSVIAGLGEAVDDALDQAALEAQKRARAAAPVGKAGSGSGPMNAPGALRASIEISTPSAYVREIGTARYYAPFVENGRRGFSASSGKMLHFWIGGREVFVKSVGPAKAQPFLGPLQAPMQAWLTAHLRGAIDRLAAR